MKNFERWKKLRKMPKLPGCWTTLTSARGFSGKPLNIFIYPLIRIGIVVSNRLISIRIFINTPDLDHDIYKYPWFGSQLWIAVDYLQLHLYIYKYTILFGSWLQIVVRLFAITPLYLQIGPLLTALSPRRLLWPLTLSSIEVDLQLVPMSMRGAQGRPVPKQRSACMGAAYIYRRRSDAYAWGRIGRLLEFWSRQSCREVRATRDSAAGGSVARAPRTRSHPSPLPACETKQRRSAGGGGRQR